MEIITRRLHIKRTVLILIILLWMCVVFYLSNQNGNESNGTSSIVTNIILNIYIKITDKSISNESLDILTYIIRKFAHFTLYFIGALPVLMLLKTYNITKLKQYIFTVLFCCIYACTDELHQLLIQGRNGNVIDVIIDTLGCVFGIIFIKIVSNVVYKVKE